MRLLLASDIHLEHGVMAPPFPDKSEYDVAIFAGDIGDARKTPFWIARNECEHRLFIPGNHEYYGFDYESAHGYMKDKCEQLGIHFLAPGAVEIGDYVFIGATLWSDLLLNGYWNEDYEHFERGIGDFHRIGYKGALFSGKACAELYKTERAFIDAQCELARTSGKTPVVITHFVPTQLAIAEKFRGDRYTPYFINDCDDLMEKHELPVWLFGHSHVRLDFIHPDAGTRIVSNAFGYPGELDKPQWKIVEL